MSDLDILATELAAGHPVTGAYNASDPIAATEINALNITRNRSTTDGGEILNATDDPEFALLTAAQQDQWLALCAVLAIDTGSGVAKSMEADFFGPGTITRANLVTVREETISRATELGLNRVREGEISMARTL